MDIYSEFVNLARLSISGRQHDAISLVRRATRKLSNERPELVPQLKEILNQSEQSILRRATATELAPQSSTDSFLEKADINFEFEPVWSEYILSSLSNIVAEHRNLKKLKSAKILPTSSILLVGPPGVGKTLAAKWLAKSLQRDLLVLNLASIMSRFLGKTGTNLSRVLNDASGKDAILFLDEFDSIGKSRDDIGDVGELKRLVNVLLQSLDNWSGDGMLIAATNHPSLLDKAVWRRFDQVIEFNFPTAKNQSVFVNRKLQSLNFKLDNELETVIGLAFDGQSFSDLDRWINLCLRQAIVQNKNWDTLFIEEIAAKLGKKSPKEKAYAASQLIKTGVSQRKASELLHISRDTVRKYADRPINKGVD